MSWLRYYVYKALIVFFVGLLLAIMLKPEFIFVGVILGFGASAWIIGDKN